MQHFLQVTEVFLQENYLKEDSSLAWFQVR